MRHAPTRRHTVQNGVMHILMEYAGGGTLHKLIVDREGELIPEDTVWEIFVQVSCCRCFLLQAMSPKLAVVEAVLLPLQKWDSGPTCAFFTVGCCIEVHSCIKCAAP